MAGIGIGSCSNGAVDNVDSGDHNGGPDYKHSKEAGATDALPFAMPGGDGNMLGKLPLAGALGNLTPGSNAVNVGGLDAGNLLSNAGGSVAPTEAAKDKKAKKATKAPAAPKMNTQVSQMASILQPAPAAPKAAAPQVAPAPRYDGGDHGGAGVLQLSDDNDGVANGNQVYVPVQIPVNVCGNGVGVVGVGLGIAGCSNGAVDNAQESAGLTEGNFLAETVTATRELF
ncbi:chaplin family protein [Longispora sp. NPDC051575]|uniref:chaplin family protein n=1 Tax=Longispora sp. NPDC051575 TaxID=3154943 RepID=UPI003448091E